MGCMCVCVCFCLSIFVLCFILCQDVLIARFISNDICLKILQNYFCSSSWNWIIVQFYLANSDVISSRPCESICWALSDMDHFIQLEHRIKYETQIPRNETKTVLKANILNFVIYFLLIQCNLVFFNSFHNNISKSFWTKTFGHTFRNEWFQAWCI